MELPKRKPNRLKNYDYSSNGGYFVTICTEGREKSLSEIVGDGFPVPKRPGEIAEQKILQIPKRYAGVTVEQYVVMPNHIHMLIRIDSMMDGRDGEPVPYGGGNGRDGEPVPYGGGNRRDGESVPYGGGNRRDGEPVPYGGGNGRDGEPVPYKEKPPALGKIIGWFKYSVTKRINQEMKTEGKRFFQRSYHDHVIRGEEDYLKIWTYIQGNPSKWQEDCFYTE